MSDLDFDLNAPAAPSLTLDAAPAAPTLTLDPEADAKVVEEAKKATPVTVEDTPLSPEDISPICVFRYSSSMPLNANNSHNHLNLKIKASFCYILLF